LIMNARTINSSQTGFTYSGNEMATVGPNSISYDLNGNLTTIDQQPATDYEYNWDNKLRSATIESNSISLKYDPAGNRIQKNSSVAGNRKYIVDVVGDLPVILLELEKTGYTDYTIKKMYIYANSEILAQYDGGSTSRYYFLHDRLGSVREVINSSGSVVKMLTYNPYGETIEEQGTFYTPWKFTGQFLDSETGQYYLRARQYSPYLARFTSYDPVMGKFEEPMSLHKYLYCFNDPINNYDLNGQWTMDIHREFGTMGSGKEGAEFDYARLDKDYPAINLGHPEWTKLHFMSREQVLPYLINSIAYGIGIGFEYSMHMWHDSYVHYDNPKYRGDWGHFWDGGRPDLGPKENPANQEAYDHSQATTKKWEEIWKKFDEGEYKGNCNEFDRSTLVWQEWFYARDEETGQLIFR